MLELLGLREQLGKAAKQERKGRLLRLLGPR